MGTLRITYDMQVHNCTDIRTVGASNMDGDGRERARWWEGGGADSDERCGSMTLLNLNN